MAFTNRRMIDCYAWRNKASKIAKNCAADRLMIDKSQVRACTEPPSLLALGRATFGGSYSDDH